MKEKEIVTRVKVLEYDELSESEKELVTKAKQATETSYSPYSKFRVGAAARLADGTIVCGSNQENAAYPSGLCAERTTLFYANARYPDVPVDELAVAAYTNGSFLHTPIPPCGACRQVMLEVEERYKQALKIILYGEKEIYVVESARELLPVQFVGDLLDYSI